MKAGHDQGSLFSCRSWAPDPKTASPAWDVTPKWGTPAPSLTLPLPSAGSGPWRGEKIASVVSRGF